jgi:dienelactone hydrolase
MGKTFWRFFARLSGVVLILPLGLGILPRYEDPQAPFSWEGSYSSTEVHFPSARDGARLYGVLDVPKPVPHHKLPVVVIGPGSGSGVQSFYQWAARDLAGHGYMTLAVDPQGVGRSDTFGNPPSADGVPWQQADNYTDAFFSAIDFIVKDKRADTTRIGIAGHSLSARAVSWVSGVDKRVKAVVAWDNLASTLEGDAGTPSGGPPLSELIGGEVPSTTSHPVTVRVPAMGMASDARGTDEPTNTDPDLKKTAYKYWRAHAQPTMELVFAGSTHLDWAQTRIKNNEDELHAFAYYTRAWFDRFLRGDRSADARLRARTVLGKTRKALLSTMWRSGASIPGYHCEDLRAC